MTFEFQPATTKPKQKVPLLIKYRKGNKGRGKEGEFLTQGIYIESEREIWDNKIEDYRTIPIAYWNDYTRRLLVEENGKSKNEIIEWAYIN